MLLIFVDRTMKKEGRGVPAVVKAWYLSEELSFGCEDSRSDDMGDYVQSGSLLKRKQIFNSSHSDVSDLGPCYRLGRLSLSLAARMESSLCYCRYRAFA